MCVVGMQIHIMKYINNSGISPVISKIMMTAIIHGINDARLHQCKRLDAAYMPD
jgi:hypothetical protein